MDNQHIVIDVEEINDEQFYIKRKNFILHVHEHNENMNIKINITCRKYLKNKYVSLAASAILSIIYFLWK